MFSSYLEFQTIDKYINTAILSVLGHRQNTLDFTYITGVEPVYTLPLET
jgi:hypothetical protein